MATPIEKQQQEVELFFLYQQALNQLEADHIEEGKSKLKSLLTNPIIQHPDSKGIYYGVCISLAEICGRENSIAEKCSSLYYYDLSNQIIENSWETLRKMAIIFRQIGLIPRAINLTLRALQYCNLPHIHPLLLHQVCCLAFLINEKEIFQKYFSMIPSDSKIKQQISEIDRYFECQFTTSFINQLLEEQQQITSKQQQIPQEELNREYFQQQYDCEISIDENDLKKFFKKIRKIFQACIIVEDGKEEIFFKDSSIFIKTSVLVKKKVKKNKTIEEQNDIQSIVIKDVKISFKSKKQLQPQILNTNVKSFCLQSALEKTHSKLVDILKKCLPNSEIINFFDRQSFPNFISTIPTENPASQNETDIQLGIYLSENLASQKFLTINHLILKLVELIFGLPTNARVDAKYLNNVYNDFIKCLVWAQFLSTNFTNDPRIELKILFYTFKEFKEKLKSDKPKTAKQIIKLKLYQKLILKLNDKLLFQQGNKKDQKDSTFQQSKEFKKIMSQIHNEFHILKNQPQILLHPQMQQLAQNQTNPAKQLQLNRILEFSLYEILEIWDQPDFFMEKGEQTNIHLAKIKNFLKDEVKSLMHAQTCKQIFNVCLKQIYQRTKKDTGKAILQSLKPVFELIFKQPQLETQLGYACLKCALIYNIFEEEGSLPLQSFLKNCYPLLVYPKKQVVITNLLQLSNINLTTLFQMFDIKILLKDLIDLRTQMKETNKKLYKKFTDYFQDHPEVQFYLAQQINKKPGVYSHCIIKLNDQRQEKKASNEQILLNSPPEFSSESEDEHKIPFQYSTHFKDILLTPDQICDQFQIALQNYKFSKEKVSYLQEHKISINLGDPKIINEIKKLVKEVIKQNTLISTKKLKSQFIAYFLKNYYLHPEFAQQKIDDIELKFFGYYLPLCYHQFQDKMVINNFINTVIYTSIPKIIDPNVYQYSDALHQHIFSKQPLKIIPKFKDLSDIIVMENKQCDYLANLYYILHLSKSEEKSFQYLLIAIAFNENPYFWYQLYMQTFELALDQLNSSMKNTQFSNDWFISQKKIQVILQKHPSLQYLFEYRFIMDLLKAQQRQVDYQSTYDITNYQKAQQAYQILLQQNTFIVPKDIIEIQHNFRAMLLIEKKIMRKLRNISVERIVQSIENFRSLNGLILQMKQKQITYFYNSVDGEFEIIQDFQINIYKYLKRFLRTNSQFQLKQLVGIIEIQHPYLLKPSEGENLLSFKFQLDNKTYKNQNQQNQQQLQLQQQQLLLQQQQQQIDAELMPQYQFYEIEKQVFLILNNLLSFFQQIISRLNQEQPQRYVLESIYYYSHILLNSTLEIPKLQILIGKKLQLIYSLQNKDIINYQKCYQQNNCSEQDEILRYYYHHDLVFIQQRSKMIKLVIKYFLTTQQWQDLLDLLEKILFIKQYEKRAIQIVQGFIKKYNQITNINIFKEIIYQCELVIKKLPHETFSLEKEEYNKMLLRFHEIEFQNKNIISEPQIERIYQVKKYFSETYSRNRKSKFENQKL